MFLITWHSVSFAQNYFENYLPEGAVARFGKGYLYDFAYSPDGTLIAVGSTIGIWLYDVQSGKAFKLLTGHNHYVNTVAFSPDGKTVASGGENIYLWDVHMGKLMKTFIGNLDGTYSLAFSPDGRTLASGGRDSTVILWDLTK